MSELKKARLGEIGSGPGPQEGSNWVDVQFNPTSLRVQISNRTAGGAQAGAQARQRPGTGEMQVSFDLVFDSADEGGDVLKKTAAVERFVRPRSAQPGKEAPPRVVFEWGTFQVQGVMDSANIDLDFFDAGGTPLRAKVAVTIKGQDPRWAYAATQTGPNPSGGNATASASGRNGPLATPAGGGTGLPAGSPGTQGSQSLVDRVVQAMPGESLQQLAARAGVDPSAWRALSSGAGNPLKLGLGQEVALPAGLMQGAATGQGAQGQDPARSTARLALIDANQKALGTGASAEPAGAGQEHAVRQGQALLVQGGLNGAISHARSQAHQQGAGQSRQAFGLGVRGTSDTDSRPWGAGVPLRPRFGSGLPASRQDPTQAAWVATAQPASLLSASGTHNSGTALRAPVASSSPRQGAAKARVSQASTGSGCGCRGGRSRKTR